MKKGWFMKWNAIFEVFHLCQVIVTKILLFKRPTNLCARLAQLWSKRHSSCWFVEVFTKDGDEGYEINTLAALWHYSNLIPKKKFSPLKRSSLGNGNVHENKRSGNCQSAANFYVNKQLMWIKGEWSGRVGFSSRFHSVILMLVPKIVIFMQQNFWKIIIFWKKHLSIALETVRNDR